MADFVVPNLTTAVVGFATTAFAGVQASFTLNLSYATQENRNISFTETRPGFLTGRRPSQGQLYPRGVYNK